MMGNVPQVLPNVHVVVGVFITVAGKHLPLSMLQWGSIVGEPLANLTKTGFVHQQCT